MKGELVIGEYHDDDDLIESVARDGRARMRVYSCGYRAVVLGRGSRVESELRLEACHADGVTILRRRGGGCAVFLDPGNVVVSVVLPMEGIGLHRAMFQTISDWLIGGLAEAGVGGVRMEGISDLAVGDRKLGGSCIHRSKGLLYYSGTILVDPDVGAMEKYLANPPKEPAYRRGRSHRDFVASLAALHPEIKIPGLVRALDANLRAGDVLSKLNSQMRRP